MVEWREQTMRHYVGNVLMAHSESARFGVRNSTAVAHSRQGPLAKGMSTDLFVLDKTKSVERR